MYEKEKQILVSMTTTLLVIIFYSLYVYRHFVAPNPDIIIDLIFWGKTFLWMAPVIIVAQIMVHIIFFIAARIITNEEIPSKEDEMDKLIELKALRISHWIFIVGFMTGMVSLVLGLPSWIMLLTLIVSLFLATIISDLTKIYYYRKGI